MRRLIHTVGRESDAGPTREHNEDSADYLDPEDEEQRRRKGALFLVADGMGGHRAGEVASQVAVEQVKEAYYADPMDGAVESLIRAVQTANRALYDMAQADPEKAGMGTTVVAAVVLGPPARVTVANVGDSRAYLLHRNHLTQITTDHSWVEAQVQARLLTREQAQKHPQRNLITRALGLRPEVDVDPFEVRLRKGDLLLLCSDGLSGELAAEQIADILRSRPPAEAATELVAQANAHGGGDNASAIVVQTETRRTRAPRRTADATPVEAPQRPGPAARLLARLSRRAHPESTAGGTTDDET